MAGFSWYEQSDKFDNRSELQLVNNKHIPICSLADVQLRFLCPSDLNEVRALCQDWFPIDYPLTWYEDITSCNRFFALAAVYKQIIIGLIVAEIKPFIKLNSEDEDILPSSFINNAEVSYILSLGVAKQYRRNGVASLLLDSLIGHLTTSERSRVKAVFLHVLTSNQTAIKFYEHRKFRLHKFLPYYYLIEGKCRDGFTYVLYINDGHPPWALYDYIKYWCSVAFKFAKCFSWFTNKMIGTMHYFWPITTGAAAHGANSHAYSTSKNDSNDRSHNVSDCHKHLISQSSNSVMLTYQN